MDNQCWVEEGEGMSDLSMYELEDIVWDEFGQSDDHIVPHPDDEHDNERAFQGENHKKPRLELIGVSSNAGDQTANRVSQEKEERDFPTLNRRRNTMLEKDPWSHIPDGVFSASCDNDSIKEVTSLASTNTRMLSHCFKSNNIDSIDNELCADDPILSDRCTAVDSRSYSNPLSHISQTDNDLSFFDNNHEDKESSDLLYYGWSDIGNFEDVDRMFRSCDSSFVLGGAGNEDELGWFSSSDAIEGSEEALKSDFQFSCPELKAILNNERSSINDSGMKSALASYKANSRRLENDEPASLSHLSSVNVSNQSSECKDEFMSKEQGIEFNDGVQFKMSAINHAENDNRMINLHKKQPKNQKHREEKIKDRCLENGGTFHDIGNLQNKDIHLPSGDMSHQVFNSVGIRLQKQNLGPDSFSYLQTNTHSNYCHSSDQTTVSPTLPGIRSKINGVMSLSPKESSYESNQGQSMESSHNPSFEGTTIKLDHKRQRLHFQKGFQPPFKREHVDLVVQSSICDPVSVRKQVHHYGNELKKQSDVEGINTGVLAELGSSNVQESSSTNSGLDEISLEATSFRQLQQVMEQLDIRTKLCIRDSLYRLARSAEQRHNYENLNGGCGDDRDISGALIAEGTNKCTGFMDMETNTNPIDRSIAHLLFHRPSDSSVMPAHNAQPLKSHTLIHGSITNRPEMPEKLVCREEIATETERKVAYH